MTTDAAAACGFCCEAESVEPLLRASASRPLVTTAFSEEVTDVNDFKV